MPFGRRTLPRQVVGDRPHGLLPFLKRWTIPIIGAITPLGLIVVNIAAFIVKHLSEFRWAITILAFVSSMMLNSWVAINLYRVVQRRRPEHTLVQDRNQEMVLVGGMGVVILFSFLAALLCYLGLRDPDSLPNAPTFISGVVAIALPIIGQALFGRERRRSLRSDAGPRVTPGPRGTPSPPAQPGQQSGYTPPRYLPPS
jgi:hypothetical protein